MEQASPLLSFLLSFVLPIALFVWLGNFMNKKLIEKAGGANSMMFGGVGKSNAKVYVQSTHGFQQGERVVITFGNASQIKIVRSLYFLDNPPGSLRMIIIDHRNA